MGYSIATDYLDRRLPSPPLAHPLKDLLSLSVQRLPSPPLALLCLLNSRLEPEPTIQTKHED